MSNFYVGEVLFETGGTIDTPGDINVTAICDCTGSTGTPGQLLSSTSTALQWITPPSSAIPCACITAKGDLIAGLSAGTPTALPVGSNGYALVANSACSAGLEWVASVDGNLTSVQVSAPLTVDNTDPQSPLLAVDAASTTAAGVVQLNDTTSSTSTTSALTAAQGKNLQDQIDALAITSNITLAGTLDTVTGDIVTVTAAGTAAGFAISSPLPAAASGNAEYFVIVTVAAASYTPPGGSAVETHVGDWFLSDGSAWQFLDVGFQAPYASTTVAGIVELATDAETQVGTDATLAVTPASAAATYVPLADYTAKGDILAATAASTPTALTVGTDGQMLYACSAATSGLCWAAAPPAAAAATPTIEGLVLGCTAGDNTSLGQNALLGATGSGNTAVGCDALCAATGGAFNTAVGLSALSINQGNFNIAVGFCSLPSNNTGQNNIGIGFTALELNDSGSGNIAIGNRAAGYSTSSVDNIAIGTDSLLNNSTGCGNVVIGYCGLSNVDGCYNTVLGHFAGFNALAGSQNVYIGCGSRGDSLSGSCQLAIGFATGSNWLTGDSTKAIRPGAGIIDCAGSCGTAGQVLMSNGSNAICWGTAGGGGGGIPDSTLTAKGDLITATAASTPTALGVGSDSQVLTACSACSTGLVWATPPTVYQVTTSGTYSFTAGTPVSILNFGTANSLIDGLLTLPINGGLVNSVWKFVKSGDPTNFNTGWNPYFQWPSPTVYDPGYFSMLYPVYPDPLSGNMILEYTPADNQTTEFTLVFSAIQGAAPTWMI